jgi:hypothetical protein
LPTETSLAFSSVATTSTTTAVNQVRTASFVRKSRS